MRKNFKRVAALSLACTMVAGSLIGCGQKANTDPTDGGDTTAAAQTDSNGGDTTAAASNGDYKDYSKGFDENVTIQIPVYDRAFEGWNPTDNYYTKWIQEQFGDKYNVTVKFVAIQRSNEVSDYTQMLASHKAPNIIYHYDMPQALAYYNEGVMQELDYDEIEYYAPTYWENLGETVQQYGAVDGENVFFFAERPDAYNWVTLIRKDWMDQVGVKMEDLTSLEKYNEMLEKWKEAGLGSAGGSLIRNNFTYDYGFRTWPNDDEERALYSDLSVAAFSWEPTKAFLKNLNYQYNNGLIDKEFYLRDEDGKMKAEFVAGNVGTYSLYLASNNDTISSLLANDPNAEVAVLDPKAGVPEGGEAQGRAYWPFGMIMGINSDTTDEQRAAVWMYLEWMSQPENLFYLQNGIEGENYTLDADGLAIPNADYKGEAALSQNKNKDYWCLVVESAQYDDDEVNEKANIANWAPAGYEYLIEDAKEYYYRDKEFSTTDALFSVVIESLSEYKADLNDLWQELYIKCATCSEEDFEKTYEDAVQEYLDAGYQDILDEKAAAIEKGEYTY